MRAWLGGALALVAVTAQASVLRDFRLSQGPESTRIVFDLGTPGGYKVFTLSNPDRLVVDLSSVDKVGDALKSATPQGIVKSIRSGPHAGGTRVVLDLTAPTNPKEFEMPASGDYGYRLIVDLTPPVAAAPTSATATAPVAAATPAPSAASSVTGATETATAASAASSETATKQDKAIVAAIAAASSRAAAPHAVELRAKPIVVAIDAGHGGIDPGAHGPHGLLEKDVTLAIARKLAKLVDAQPGMRAVLTRDSDTYVDLRERTQRAREAQADLFISVHCNALRDPRMRGTAVYVLSDHGASSEQARWLANRENSADMVGGVDLHDKDNQVAAVLLDISQTATMEASFDLGNRMLDSLAKINVLQKPRVQQAGFMVLKSPDIPSVLVETAFITNSREERLLGSSSYQGKLASSMLDGIRGYFSHYRPQEEIVAEAAPEQTHPEPERARAIPVSMTSSGGGGGGLRGSALRGD